MEGCKHIFIRGVNAGNKCNLKIFYYIYCKKHFKKFYEKWKLDRNINPFNGKLITLTMKKDLEELDVTSSPTKRKSPVRKSPGRKIADISQEECEEFLANMEINPLTKRKIKRDGPVYKTLISKCSPNDKNVAENKSTYFQPENITSSLDNLKKICDEWFENKYIDPITRKKILPHYKAFKELAKSCADIGKESMVKVTGLPFLVPRIDDGIHTNTLSEVEVPQKINNWVLGKKLGEGGFGIVYECYDINNHNELPKSIKIEHINSGTLNMEANFYKNTKGINNKYLPVLYDIGTTDKFRYIVIEKLEMLNSPLDRISDIIGGLKSFADMNMSHGDIKFENLLQRITTKEVVFVDFGLTFPIDRLKTTPNKELVMGTILFMSINAHNGIISYSNDFESLVYCLLDMIHKLPWNDVVEFENVNYVLSLKEEFRDKILSKHNKTMKDFKLDKIPILYLLVKKALTTKIHEKPDYKFFEKHFK